MKIHIAQPNETLRQLATKYNVPVERLLEANTNLQEKEPLKAGSKIFIPTGKVALVKESAKASQISLEETDSPEEAYSFKETYELDDSSSRLWESSAAETDFSPSSEFATAHSMPMMPPRMPMPWDSSMMPANPYMFPGNCHGYPMYHPCFYPHPMMPYHYDPYYSVPPLYHSFYEDESWERESAEESELWASKESSSVEG